MRKKDDTLRDTLLECARRIADAEGLRAVNIRAIARGAGVAAGTVYNYFANKDEILLALTEEEWRRALLELRRAVTANSFCGQLEEIFFFLQDRIRRSAGKLMGSLGNVETTGQARMAAMQETVEEALVQGLSSDPGIDPGVWDGEFTREKFAHFVMMNLMLLLRTRASDPNFLIAVVKRTIDSKRRQ